MNKYKTLEKNKVEWREQKQKAATILQKYWEKLGYEDFDSLQLLDELVEWKYKDRPNMS